jgi:hypothetical protein
MPSSDFFCEEAWGTSPVRQEWKDACVSPGGTTRPRVYTDDIYNTSDSVGHDRFDPKFKSYCPTERHVDWERPKEPPRTAQEDLGGAGATGVPELAQLGPSAVEAVPSGDRVPQDQTGLGGLGSDGQPTPRRATLELAGFGKAQKAKAYNRKECAAVPFVERGTAASYWPSPGLPDAIFKFGANKGKSVSSLARLRIGYLHWCKANLKMDQWTGKAVLPAVIAHLNDFAAFCAKNNIKP